MDGACDAVSHSFENALGCQSALLGEMINFQAIGRFCNIADSAEWGRLAPAPFARLAGGAAVVSKRGAGATGLRSV
ncbi:hypothetical protein [Bradyrhizobium acaciae]|uniref:hypothetical protein n=1 Tax=Bradyrhizobium acaciae TaxID=2683706 RepID=UPI001E394762|nr:hypothetical protein [Bradyrhizobium acaciae]MCC8984467.1 hypothetical protein [Bradyrhizobium acaciae]